MYCTNCGKEIKENAHFCPYCGKIVEEATDRNVSGAKNNYDGRENRNRTNPKKKKKRHTGRIVAIALGIAALAAVLLLAFLFLNGTFSEENYIGTEKGTPLTEEEAGQVYLADISDKDWETFETNNEEIRQIVLQYSNDNGYIEPENTENVLNAVAAKVDQLYRKGSVLCYQCNEDSVCFEYTSGLFACYSPSREGYLSSGEYAVNILSIDPCVEDDLRTAYASLAGGKIDQALSNQIFQKFQDKEVSIEQLENLPLSEFLLWYGHGNFFELGPFKYPVLNTRTTADVSQWELTKQTALFLVASIAPTGTCWSITPLFVTRNITLNSGLVFLGACYSGRTDSLASSFLNAGGEVVFVNVGEEGAVVEYEAMMLDKIMDYMCGNENDVFYSAEEALESANQYYSQKFLDDGGGYIDSYYFATFEDFVDAAESHLEIRGEGSYTLCSCIRGEVSFEDEMSDEEIKEIIGTLTVRIADQEGIFKDYPLKDSSFNINDIDSGTYKVSLIQDGELVSEEEEISVNDHRYTPVTLSYIKEEAETETETETLQDVFQEEPTVSNSPFNEDSLTMTFNGHKYQWFDVAMSWTEAKAYCESLGGHLATITSEDEEAAVLSYIQEHAKSGDIWIGLTDENSEGDWSTWITGEPVDYTNWGSGEPNNGYTGGQDYGVICNWDRDGSKIGEWDDLNPIQRSVTLLCEWDDPSLISSN